MLAGLKPNKGSRKIIVFNTMKKNIPLNNPMKKYCKFFPSVWKRNSLPSEKPKPINKTETIRVVSLVLNARKKRKPKVISHGRLKSFLADKMYKERKTIIISMAVKSPIVTPE